MHHLEFQVSPDPDTQRLAELDAQAHRDQQADPEALIELRAV